MNRIHLISVRKESSRPYAVFPTITAMMLFQENQKKSTEYKQVHRPVTHERILFLDSLRAVAIIMVVGVHALAYSPFLLADQRLFFTFLLHTVAVPVFFLVDGYLFARSISHSESFNYQKYVMNSCLRLLIPWLIFTFLYALSRYVFEMTGFLKENLIVGHSFKDIIISAYGSVYAGQMYFLFSLFLVRLCTPIIRRIISIKNFYILLILVFCYYILYHQLKPFVRPFLSIEGGQEPILHALWGLQYYFVGIVCYQSSKIFEHKKAFAPVFVLFFLVLVFKNQIGFYRSDIVQLLYLLNIFLFFALFPEGFSILNAVGKNTMGIFLLHAPIVLKGVSVLSNEFVRDPVMNFIVNYLGTLLLTIFVVKIINSVPYGSLLFGMRNLQKDV